MTRETNWRVTLETDKDSLVFRLTPDDTRGLRGDLRKQLYADFQAAVGEVVQEQPALASYARARDAFSEARKQESAAETALKEAGPDAAKRTAAELRLELAQRKVTELHGRLESAHRAAEGEVVALAEDILTRMRNQRGEDGHRHELLDRVAALGELATAYLTESLAGSILYRAQDDALGSWVTAAVRQQIGEVHRLPKPAKPEALTSDNGVVYISDQPRGDYDPLATVLRDIERDRMPSFRPRVGY